MKKWISRVLVLAAMAVILPRPAGAASAPSRYYTDVSASDSFYSASTYLYEHGDMDGTVPVTSAEKGKFSPASPLTRSQLVTILWRMLNKPQPSGTTSAFSDCAEGAFYYDAVLWACSSEVGILAGYEDGTFRPLRGVTHQEELTFLYRFACYGAYSSGEASIQGGYIDALDASPLTYKSGFSNYARPAAGWAYQDGFITNLDLKPGDGCTRGAVAESIYTFYQKYQRKFGLSVVNTRDMEYVAQCGAAMQTLFRHYGAAEALSGQNITQVQFIDAIQSAFSAAKPLDICYLYCASHGGTAGLALFDGSPVTLTPQFLRDQIDQYKGTFVLLISGCNTGTFVSTGGSGTCSGFPEEDVFDAAGFVAALVGEESGAEPVENADLRGSQRIKVLCSSRKDEASYMTSTNATKYWCLGSGYDYGNQSFAALLADTNSDDRISLEELDQYAYEEVLKRHPQQHMVCYPSSDRFIIFETHY